MSCDKALQLQYLNLLLSKAISAVLLSLLVLYMYALILDPKLRVRVLNRSGL